MRYENNRILRDYLDRGAAGTFREHLQHPAFELDSAAFAATLEEVRCQHPHLGDEEAEARAVFRLLTSGAPPDIVVGPAEVVAVALPSRWHRVGEWARRVAPALWLWLRILWAIAVLAALCAIAGRAEPGPDANVVSVGDRLHALEIRPPQLFQLSNGAARVQFQSGGAWSFVSSGTPFPITCVSGCSAAGAFSDNSAFSVGSTAIVPIGALYDSGAAPAISSGNAGRVRMDANSYLYTDCVVGCSGGSTTPMDGFTTPTNAGNSASFLMGFNGTTWDQLRDDANKYLDVDVKNSSLAVTGTFWQATQPVSGTFWQTTQPVSGTFWQTTQPVSGSGVFEVGPTTSANTLSNPFFTQLSDGTHGNTFNSSTYTSKYGLDSNLLGTLGTAFKDAGYVTAEGGAADGSASAGNPIPMAGKGSGDARVPIVCDNWTPISLASTTALKVVTKSSGKNVYICSINLVSAGANNVALVAGTLTSTNCDTSTAGLAGGTTAATGWNLAANGGLTQGSGIGVIAATASTGLDVCLFASASSQVSGVISWTQF